MLATHAEASPRVAAVEESDPEATRLVLLELWPRVLVTANVDTAETGTGLDVPLVTGGAAFALSRERTQPGFVLRVNRDFVAENDRLIKGVLVANRLNLQDTFRSFALDRVVVLASGALPHRFPSKRSTNSSAGVRRALRVFATKRRFAKPQSRRAVRDFRGFWHAS